MYLTVMYFVILLGVAEWITNWSNPINSYTFLDLNFQRVPWLKIASVVYSTSLTM